MTQQLAAEPGQVGQQSCVLCKPAAQRIADQHLARTGRFHQPWRPQYRITPQFERVAGAVVDPPPDDMHARQSPQRPQIDLAVVDHQVFAGGQRVAQVLGEVRLLEERFAAHPGRHDDDGRIVVQMLGEVGQGVSQRAKEGGEFVNIRLAVDAGEHALDDDPVLERVTRAGGGLRPVGDDQQPAVAPANEVGRVEVDRCFPSRSCPDAGTQKPAVGINQFRWQQASADQFPLAVDVPQNFGKQFRALGEARFDLGPFVAAVERGNRVQSPGPALRPGIPPRVVRHPVLTEQTPDLAIPPEQLFARKALQVLEQMLPVRQRRDPRGKQLVVHARPALVLRQQVMSRRRTGRLEMDHKSPARHTSSRVHQSVQHRKPHSRDPASALVSPRSRALAPRLNHYLIPGRSKKSEFAESRRFSRTEACPSARSTA